MKIFHGKINGLIAAVCLSSSLWAAHGDQPGSIIPAYENKISHILFSQGAQDQQALTFILENDPICVYTPLTFQNFMDDHYAKTYFFPRTKCHSSQIKYLEKELKHSLKQMGIDFYVRNIQNDHHGLSITFALEAFDAYDIIKVVDADKKMIRFELAAKI